VTFDVTAEQPLAAGVGGADPAKWTVRFDGVRYGAYALSVAAFDTIHLDFIPLESEDGPDVLNYSNAPSDVSDTLGRQLAAFSDRPL
jgi:hypothetical protein